MKNIIPVTHTLPVAIIIKLVIFKLRNSRYSIIDGVT